MSSSFEIPFEPSDQDSYIVLYDSARLGETVK